MDGHKYVLGIDLGAQSCGWAAVKLDGPNRILGLGTRIFPAGVEDGLEKGTEVTKNVQRRQARLLRRQTDRKARRRVKIYHLLQNAGLLPQGETGDRHTDLASLDNRLKQGNTNPALLPYQLRAEALGRKLEPYELGRAFHHLAQRRGFLSNRKGGTSAAAAEKEGVVKEGISTLRADIERVGARTLGEYFAQVDPHENRIRTLWTSRKMYQDEFNLICKTQQTYHPQILTKEFVTSLGRALFHQRPLKSQRHLIGKCELEPKRKRAAIALLLPQRFRMLQVVNNLRIPDGEFLDRQLTGEERHALLEELDAKGDLSFPDVRKLLGLPRTLKLNLEAGGEKKLLGNRTSSALLKAFGKRWLDFSPKEQERIVNELLSTQNDALVVRRARTAWGCSETEAEAVSLVRLEDGHGALSTAAMRKLLPPLVEGLTFAAARRKTYPEQFQANAPVDYLPPVRDAISELRNPAVERALTELRKVVNAVIREHGKPESIHIETARELKQPKWQRIERSKRMRTQESARQDAAQKILEERPGIRVSNRDKEKFLLAVECNWCCPYTGAGINVTDLFGPEPRFDIEHIIPYSRCLDNSFFNKTLCLNDHNRHVKGNQTPWEAYGANEEEYERILQRVRRFAGDARDAKLDKFRQRETDTEGFIERQLNDTRYASRLGADYLGKLYGGRVDGDHNTRVFTITGQVTATLRREWDLHAVLNDGKTANGGATPKSRDDHRHHAVDALVVALTNTAQVKQLSQQSAYAQKQGSRSIDLESPWNDFVRSVREAVDEIVVSHRVDRRANGQLHKETLYGPQRSYIDKKGAEKQIVHIRRALAAIKKPETIVDPAVRAAIEQKLEELGGASELFKKEENLPSLQGPNGQSIKIRKARVRETVYAIPIGKGARLRRVELGSNHHLEVFAEVDENGQEKRWRGNLVSTYAAMLRKRASKPLVAREQAPGTKFKFSLAGGDTIWVDHPKLGSGLYIVRTISQAVGRQDPVVAYVRITDARLKKDILGNAAWGQTVINSLRKMNCQKFDVGPIGKAVTSND